jgi:hypothetical protein
MVWYDGCVDAMDLEEVVRRLELVLDELAAAGWVVEGASSGELLVRRRDRSGPTAEVVPRWV